MNAGTGIRTRRPGASLRTREDSALYARLRRSAEATAEGADVRTGEVLRWLAGRAARHRFRVDRIPFADLDGWSFEHGTGNLVHDSGRFFTVEGLSVAVDGLPEWRQPIIVQPEVGVLGILAREFDGVLHFLMQAKMEPGNPGLLQLSPTVQATYSNYTRVHRGAPVRYLDHFLRADRGRVIVDVLQSEHGSWFLRKANRNMVVEVEEDVPRHEDFVWLTLGQLGELLRRDNVVNMDARTVLACVPAARGEDDAALHSDVELLSWFTAERAGHDLRARRIPLAGVPGWRRDDWSIGHEEGRHFRVVAVSARADSREVAGWTQPLFEPVRRGLAAFVARRFAGVPHVLAHARVEGGFLDTVELGPTVQCTPEHYDHLRGDVRPPFLDLVLTASRVRYSAVHSEEGGRFLDAETRYMIVDADPSQAPAHPPPGYRWITPGQLGSLLRHGHYLNVQARTLFAAINSGATTC
jgi:dTDP-4-dehydro-6-deoxy-alpha-D-glucopyranose 2,3-dehydratase